MSRLETLEIKNGQDLVSAGHWEVLREAACRISTP